MGAADQRVAELLERWLTSVDLHVRYLALDDAAYAKVQDWPKHQRPTRWVVELARSRLLELQRIVDERGRSGDTAFAEALERMAFLTNLLGSDHVDRFIPLAQRQPAQVEETLRIRKQRAEPRTASRPAAASRTARPPAAPGRRPAAAAPKPAPAKPAATPKPAPSPAEPASGDPIADPLTALVIADAARLVNWGREWPQIAGLIARLADRPSEAEVWKILRKHRAAIEAQARRPRD